MLFHDEIVIQAPPEQIFAFFETMEQHYTTWHLDHIVFRWISGEGLKTGAVAYFEERINGELLKKQVKFTRVVPPSTIDFAPTFWLMRLFLPRLSFYITPQGDGCLFRAEILMRVGPLWVRTHQREFDAVRQHMREEGENLKRLMEGDEPAEKAE